jgi:DNA-binding HxlR family transcriptional regulator
VTGAMSDELIAHIAGGLVGRLRSLVVALDRLDRLESGSGEWLSGFAGAELPEAATALTLRALHASADPANFTILTALTADDSQAIDRLIETTGVGRLVLSERLNDLVQVGLATRMIDTDHAQITAAGASLVHLVDQIITEVTEQYLATSTK